MPMPLPLPLLSPSEWRDWVGEPSCEEGEGERLWSAETGADVGGGATGAGAVLSMRTMRLGAAVLLLATVEEEKCDDIGPYRVKRNGGLGERSGVERELKTWQRLRMPRAWPSDDVRLLLLHEQ